MLHGRFILISLVLLFFCHTVCAQKEVPVDERDVFYLYQQFGIAHEPAMKVVVISSHLYRYKYDDGSHGRVKTALNLDFSKKMSRIKENEYNPEASSGTQVHENDALKLNFAFVNHGIAEATGPETYLTLNSSTKLLKESRDLLINQFIKDGFTIFQTDFEEDVAGKFNLEKIERLSSLWIPVYRRGDILSIAKKFQRTSGSGSAGITVQEKKPSKSSASSGSENKDRAAIANAKRYEAGLFESEGDRLMKLGDLSGAATQYQAAQAAFYTDRVQTKLNNAETTLQSSAALIGGGLDLAENVSMAFDDLKVPKFSAWGITYSGFAYDDRNKGFSPELIPSSTSLTYGGYRIFAMEIGFSYVRSPVYTMFLTNGDGQKINQTIQVHRATVGPTASFGLAIPFKHFVIYGMYGWDVPFWVTEANLITDGYVYKEIKDDLGRITFQPKTDVGLKIKIPGTRIGIGAHYRMNKQIGEKIKLKENGYSIISKGSNQYFVGGSELKTYKYEEIGVSLYILMKK